MSAPIPPPRPQVSVVTCTFNRPVELRRARDSVLAQTLPDLQHIIVEDFESAPSIRDQGLHGCVLATMPYRTGYPGFLCRNAGAKLAEADLIAFLDDDNWWEPAHLASLLATLQALNADFAWSSTRLRDPDGTPIGTRVDGRPRRGSVDISEILCKRALFLGSGGLDPRDGRGADGEMVERWVHGGARWAHSSEVTLNYTVSPKEVLTYRTYCLQGTTGYRADGVWGLGGCDLGDETRSAEVPDERVIAIPGS